MNFEEVGRVDFENSERRGGDGIDGVLDKFLAVLLPTELSARGERKGVVCSMTQAVLATTTIWRSLESRITREASSQNPS